MPPKGARQPQLRACLVCSILQSQKDFIDWGCPNCEEVMDMRGSAERVVECTSTIYDGMIALMEPEESWVARWQRIGKSCASEASTSVFISFLLCRVEMARSRGKGMEGWRP